MFVNLTNIITNLYSHLPLSNQNSYTADSVCSICVRIEVVKEIPDLPSSVLVSAEHLHL